jgi:hypothetical protein
MLTSCSSTTSSPRLFSRALPARETDDIANFAFISGKANRKISAKEPALYFPEVQEANGEQPFESQCIPTDPKLLTVERYKAFLVERRRLIAERLNTFLGPSEGTSSP